VTALPLTQKQANAYIAENHRHHYPVQGDKFRFGIANDDGEIIGVLTAGRPVARTLDDGKTLEVTRLCTNGSENVCSFAYSKAARIAKELGYHRVITYILIDEPGTSLKAAGWVKDGETKGDTWDRPGRRRIDKAPTCPKQRWTKVLIEGGL
jgi:hypothetical protein